MKRIWWMAGAFLIVLFALIIFLFVAGSKRANELAGFELATTQELRAEVEALRGGHRMLSKSVMSPGRMLRAPQKFPRSR